MPQRRRHVPWTSLSLENKDSFPAKLHWLLKTGSEFQGFDVNTRSQRSTKHLGVSSPDQSRRHEKTSQCLTLLKVFRKQRCPLRKSAAESVNSSSPPTKTISQYMCYRLHGTNPQPSPSMECMNPMGLWSSG